MWQIESFQFNIVLIFTVGFSLASLLGYLANRIHLTAILGYLLAGYLIGPYSPGFVADHNVAEQLAEIGVIFMMFGVGLQFKWQDLKKVNKIAIPGAIFQTGLSTLIGTLFAVFLGWTWQAGVVLGFSIGVASTMVLVRLLTDNNLLKTPQGHIALGWLIVEDIITVLVLLSLPILTGSDISYSIFISILKFCVLILVLHFAGMRFVRFILAKAHSAKSEELFILTVLAIMFVIAIGSVMLFGTSIALGAFLAGMMIAQTDFGEYIFKNTSSLRYAFVVTFFLSVGMLFNPLAILENFQLFVGVIAIIFIVKPLAAFVVASSLGESRKTALIVSIALAQVGEFSFILAEEASRLKILPDAGYDVIVAAAFLSISLNGLICQQFSKRLAL